MAIFSGKPVAEIRPLTFSESTLAIQAPIPYRDTKPYQADQLLHLSTVLQTTLDVGQVTELFGKEVQFIIPFTGLNYRHPQQNIQFSFGKSGRHSCQYQLVINQHQLGDITFTKDTVFTKQECQDLEQLLCSLVYPLRNTLLYHQALQDAHKDPLTGVNNRAIMNETLRREIDLAHRHNKPLSLVVVDIDHFKQVNDNHGHAIGDCLIKALADCMTQCIRGTDMLFRYGGEEFVILLTNTDEKGAALLAERLRQRVEKLSCTLSNENISMTISAGVASLKTNDNCETLFIKADKAMYQAKTDGRNRVRAA